MQCMKCGDKLKNANYIHRSGVEYYCNDCFPEVAIQATVEELDFHFGMNNHVHVEEMLERVAALDITILTDYLNR